MDFEDKTFPCPLCDEELEIKNSRTGKPYITCNSCGLQMFVRYQLGIQRLKEIVRNRLF